MPRKDNFHELVKQALIRTGWDITDDPLYLSIGNVNIQIDLAAEPLIAANRGEQKIAVDRLEHYRTSLQNFLESYSSYGPKNPEVETQIICDTEHDHYMLFRTGWDGERRMHHCIFHFDIKDGKIWLQANNTDIEVDLELAEMGIHKEEIVVGFHHLSMRKYSDFAVA